MPTDAGVLEPAAGRRREEAKAHSSHDGTAAHRVARLRPRRPQECLGGASGALDQLLGHLPCPARSMLRLRPRGLYAPDAFAGGLLTGGCPAASDAAAINATMPAGSVDVGASHHCTVERGTWMASPTVRYDAP